VEHPTGDSFKAASAKMDRVANQVRGQLHGLLRTFDELVEQASQRAVRTNGDGARLTAERVDGVLRARRLRGKFFDSELFADPAWDILLELFAAELGQFRVSVGSLCVNAIPAATAIRWMKLLEKEGLLIRRPDPYDRRRIYVSLSSTAALAMESLFAAIAADEILF
jgi:hypothetical protein